MVKNGWVFAALGLMLAACGGPAQDEAEITPVWTTLDGAPPLVIAHRGASGYLPEHTLEAYGLAIEQGADVIEPDLVFTKDGVLVARHDRYLSTTTDVAAHPEFADRKKPNADPNDAPREDWWVEDFTLEEVKTLRAVQPFPGRSKGYDGLYEIPTFDEVLALVSARADEIERRVGVYPETKHPGYFQSIGLDFEQSLLAALDGFDAGPVFIQSFEPEILKRLKGKTDAILVQLVYDETPGAGPNIPLTEIAAYADGVGPSKFLLLGEEGESTSFVKDAHALGLMVHAWTFRDDQKNPAIDTHLTKQGLISFVVSDSFQGLPEDIMMEYFYMTSAGVDGMFTDFPDTAVGFRKAWTK